MKLSQLDGVDAKRLRRALEETGLALEEDADTWESVLESPVSRLFSSLLGLALPELPSGGEEWGRVMGLLATAFALGATYATLPSTQTH